MSCRWATKARRALVLEQAGYIPTGFAPYLFLVIGCVTGNSKVKKFDGKSMAANLRTDQRMCDRCGETLTKSVDCNEVELNESDGILVIDHWRCPVCYEEFVE